MAPCRFDQLSLLVGHGLLARAHTQIKPNSHMLPCMGRRRGRQRRFQGPFRAAVSIPFLYGAILPWPGRFGQARKPRKSLCPSAFLGCDGP
jgi:hypothetical protein